ncbi:fumarylacetoacetate hydrolase family protein [Sinomonas notoginsengisoli]|uniref:fumarylacetoacetate hydrolase family protein n=1 Tax=Sinomonas notoginsengisoli TaxID=1457311 RepID=UPI001F289AA9|nr:fumarylacetoacetate hydrolase family protein [Sinomonas notoginsengisoli]
MKARTACGSIRWFYQSRGGLRVLDAEARLGTLLALEVPEALRMLEAAPLASEAPVQVLAPVDDHTEVWAAGVTYQISKEARMEESTEADIYDRVYDAERPELFFKALGWRVSGPGGAAGIRSDSELNVPEPELALVLNFRGEVLGYTICNDMSSRSIEGENPLYLPQAKVYRHSCAIGPWIRLATHLPHPEDAGIAMEITRHGEVVWKGDTSTAKLKRTFSELSAYLLRAEAYPEGAVLSTGTSVVPGLDFILSEGDTVSIAIEGIGTLANPVARV